MNLNLRKLLRDLSIKSSLGIFLRKCLHLLKNSCFKLRNIEPNFMKFDSKQFYLQDSGKNDSFLMKNIYMDDEGAAICYGFGINYIEHSERIKGDNFKQEIARILDLKRRSPKLVVDIGCGLGMIDAALTYAGVRCIGIDPSAGAKEGYEQTFKLWLNISDYTFVNKKANEGIDYVVKNYGLPDTVIMCETIEHIPESEFDKFWADLVPILRISKGIFIVTNGLSEGHFPTVIDGTGWCHIREINNDLYDRMASYAEKTLFRYKSHLVLQF